jgi:hypothetical protein
MNLTTLKILFGWTFLIFLIFQLMNELHGKTAIRSIQIATTRHPLATAYNNGRRMVRDSKDHRYVVYQDIRGDLPIICLIHSANGKFWSQPDTLAQGAFPSLAIDQADRLFLVWQAADTSDIYFTYSKDSAASWNTPYIKISQVNSEKTQFPVIEVGYRRIHVAWQQNDVQMGRWVQEIFWNSLALDSLESSFATPINVSHTAADSKFPSMAHNLGFQEGKLHLVWYDSTSIDSSIMAIIMYRAVDESLTIWDPSFSHNAHILSNNKCPKSIHPAFSVGFHEFVHVVWGTLEQNRFFSHFFEIEDLAFLNPAEIQTNAEPYICVDDVYLHTSSIVWTNNDQIFYGQIFFPQNYLTNPTSLSEANQSKKFHPSVCYKNFRYDSLDAVWTEGNAPPYNIIYRRIEKNYGAQAVEQNDNNPQFSKKFVLKQNCPNPFNSITTIEYEIPQMDLITIEIFDLLGQKIRTLVKQHQSVGVHLVLWDGYDDQGKLSTTGIYLCRLLVGKQQSVQKIAFIK